MASRGERRSLNRALMSLPDLTGPRGCQPRARKAMAVVTSQATNSQDNPLVGLRSQRVDRRGHVPAVPRRPVERGPRLARLLRRLPARSDGSRLRPRRPAASPPQPAARRPPPPRARGRRARDRHPLPRAAAAPAPPRQRRRAAPAAPAAAPRARRRAAQAAPRRPDSGRGPHHPDPWRRREDRVEHGRVAAGADRDQRAGGAGEAASPTTAS